MRGFSEFSSGNTGELALYILGRHITYKDRELYFFDNSFHIIIEILGLIRTCRQNHELVSIDKVLQLFIDKLGTNRLFGNYP